MQLSFEMEYTDPVTHTVVPWAMPDKPLIEALRTAPWKVVDVETTGLNPASKEINFSGKDLRRGVNPRLRLRVLSALYPREDNPRKYHVVSFDFDQLTAEERKAVSEAAMTNAVIGHNVGFDTFWCRQHTRQKPSLLLDTMLIARVLHPQHPLEMAHICNDEEAPEDIRMEAIAMFKQARSGWALDDLAANLLRRVVSKKMQGPRNWAEPFLSQEAYDYATGDVVLALEILLKLFGLNTPERLLERYQELRAKSRGLRIIEPQVMDIVEMREHGMPWSKESARAYVNVQAEKVLRAASEMAAMEPKLGPLVSALSDMNKGISAELKNVIGQAFSSRGVSLETTSATGAFKIGEKDLRRVKAAINPEAKAFFDTWVALNKAKKAAGMANEVTMFAQRSYDDRIHANTGHGPVTGRLSSSEPNVQQFPRDQAFRDCVRARPGHKMVACDYSALDMRVGAALAIRAQRQIIEAYMGDRPVQADVLRVIARVLENTVSLESARALEAKASADFLAWKAKVDDVADSGDARKKYWARYRELSRSLLLASFQRCLKQVRDNAEKEGTAEWGSLRNAFNIPNMDIHTWTALSMRGQDPATLLKSLSDEEVAKALKKYKKELGDARQTGKVGNLSLLYAMKVLGLLDAAAKNYNIHWTFEEGSKVLNDWLASYVEIDLWHKWTELNPADSVYIPDPDYGGDFKRKSVYKSYTLGGRVIYAFGLNAALSYEDQSTGADILGLVMQTLRTEHPQIFECVANQVHDELVFEIPDEHVEDWTAIIHKVMVDCAEVFLMPYGVHAECSPAVGDTWLKD